MYKILFWQNENKKGKSHEIGEFSSIEDAVEACKVLVHHFLGYTYAEVFDKQNKMCFFIKK